MGLHMQGKVNMKEHRTINSRIILFTAGGLNRLFAAKQIVGYTSATTRIILIQRNVSILLQYCAINMVLQDMTEVTSEAAPSS